MKTFVPKDRLATNLAWTADYSAGTVRLIGIAEVLGAIGLVLPWLTGIAPILTRFSCIYPLQACTARTNPARPNAQAGRS